MKVSGVGCQGVEVLNTETFNPHHYIFDDSAAP
jgi:hypothetical protein